MEEARLRAEYEGARGAAEAARARGPGAGGCGRGAPLAELAARAGALARGAQALAPGERRGQWEERASWVRREVVALAAEALGGGGAAADPGLFWGNVADALSACAEHGAEAAGEAVRAEEALRAERETLRAEVGEARARVEALTDELLDARRAVDAATSGPLPALEAATMESAVEAVQLRAQLGARVAEVERLETEVRTLCGALEEEKKRRRQGAPSALAPAGGAPGPATGTVAGGAAADAEVEALQSHNRLLSMNLENHARVVEKLVELNAELMGKANARAQDAEFRARDAAPPGAGVPGSPGGLGTAAGTPGPPPPTVAPAAPAAEPADKPGAEIANAFAAFLTEDDPLSPKRASDLADPGEVL